MKSIILTIAGICLCSMIFAQDTIFLIKGGGIRAKVIEVGVNEIKYKNFDNLDGPIIYLSKSDISMIKYQNGTKTVMNKQFKPVLQNGEKQEQAPVQEQSQVQKQAAFNDTRNYKNAVGLAAGFSSGFGLSYRYQPKNFGIQVALFPYRDKYSTIFYPGITFLYKLKEANDMIFFIYQSNEYYYYKSRLTPYTTTEYFNDGIGMGIEFKIYKRIVFDLMAGYAQYQKFERISFTGETGIFFRL